MGYGKFLLRNVVFLTSIITSQHVNAGWYVGSRSPADTITSSNVALSYINPETSVTISAFNDGGMYFIAANSVAGDATNPHFTWTYISMPSRVSLAPNSYIEFSGVGAGYSEVGVMGGQRVYSQEKQRNWLWGTYGSSDYRAGSTSMTDTWTRPQLIVKARLNDGGDLVPGVRTVEVPLRVAQVAATNDSASKNAAIAWANANLYQTPYISTTWIIQATITPKCWVDNVNLDLTFGRLSKSTLEGRVSSQKTINIACNTATDVNVDLVPVAPVPAVSKSATSCGDGLACIVEFDGQQSSVRYPSLTSKALSIRSKLHVSDLSRVKEGKFEGGAILRVIYN
ncbi:TPA: hypothetical protein PBQ45_004452 [Escherichia coli]|nr:hypothetical protein [Escherichia coli]